MRDDARARMDAVPRRESRSRMRFFSTDARASRASTDAVIAPRADE